MDFLFELPDGIFTWVDYIVVWTGFSVIIGFFAGLLILGPKNMLSTFATVAVGYAGTIAGWSVAALYIGAADKIEGDWKQKMFAPATIVIALAGAATLFYLFKKVRQSGQESAAG